MIRLCLQCRPRYCIMATLLPILIMVVLLGAIASNRNNRHRLRVAYNAYLANDGPWRTDGGPPKYLALRNWEATLPQHDLSLPLPEGKSGRYVKFSNQVQRLGWNNCFNEL